MNRIVLMGRLTADPELKATTTNVSVIQFTIAVDRKYVKQGEERKADFITIVAWRGTAEFVAKYFTKGKLIAIDGSLQTRSYEKDGNKRTVVEVVADSVEFCGDNNKSAASNNAATATAPASPTYQPIAPDASQEGDDGDLPF